MLRDRSLVCPHASSGRLDRIRERICEDACIERAFRVVPAIPCDSPSGERTTTEVLSGRRSVWADKGNVRYTHTRDREPGGIAGDKWATGAGSVGLGWMPIQRRRDFED